MRSGYKFCAATAKTARLPTSLGSPRGAAAACLLWFTASAGITVHTETFDSYNQVFGVSCGVNIRLTWLSLSAFAMLLGAASDTDTDTDTA
ncbi:MULTISPECIES: YhjD/YihY/BrkB family envelope integrity protein [unclassified Leisingera]|uniref:YhjD/YihY/BrkB family envelope integrity protein n=1 Tax=unclassified Leisingera TaxID=2614906 RepID=UPI0009DCBBD9